MNLRCQGMNVKPSIPVGDLIPVEALVREGSAIYPYVADEVQKREKDIRALLESVLKILKGCQGPLVDVGPGEGVSSMALGTIFPALRIVGIEQDDLHIAAAWPHCKRYSNVQLYWGAMPPNPACPCDGERGMKAPGAPVHDPNFKCRVLFSWMGMARVDIFERPAGWQTIVEDCCIFVVPRIWRGGPAVLPDQDRQRLREFCVKLGLPEPEWKPVTKIGGFDRFESRAIGKKVRAKGWVLWLSGILGEEPQSLAKILQDKSKQELSDIELEMEVVLGAK